MVATAARARDASGTTHETAPTTTELACLPKPFKKSEPLWKVRVNTLYVRETKRLSAADGIPSLEGSFT